MHYQTWKSFKIYIKIRINIAPSCFGLAIIIRELVLRLAKVMFMLRHSVKLHRYIN